MSDNTTHNLPAYLSYSMGLLWLWSGTQPLFFMPEMSFAAFGRHSRSVAMADINRRFTAGHRFCLFMLQPLSRPFRNMAAAIADRRGIQPDYCFQAARNVGAPFCAFGKKPADYGYFIFPVSIRRR